MAEKILHEIRFIETDDGFRVEIKGDKERMRKMGFGPGMRFGFGKPFGPGPGDRPGGRHRWHRHGGGQRKHGPGPGFGPWMWGCWFDEFDEEEEEEPPRKA